MLKSKFLLIPFVLLVLGYILLSVFVGKPNPMAMMQAGGPIPVATAPVIKKDIMLWDEYSGRLTAVDNVEVRARVAGMVESVHFEDGQEVQQGDLLFIIDPRPYKAALDAAQADYNLANSEFQRAEPLLKERAISQRSFEQRKNALATAKAALTQARLNLEYTHIKAPISGKVGRREVTPGNLVNVGTPVLTTVVSQNPIYADFEADEQHFLQYLAAYGSSPEALERIPVMLDLPSDNTVTRSGKINSFDNQLNVNSGTIRVRAVFDNADGRLVPGMFARVRISSGDSGPALLVAGSAIGTDQSKKFVYTLNGDNKVIYREVSIGPEYERLQVIESGLQEGEQIIVKGIQRIKPGMEITPQPTTMEDTVTPDQALVTHEPAENTGDAKE